MQTLKTSPKQIYKTWAQIQSLLQSPQANIFTSAGRISAVPPDQWSLHVLLTSDLAQAPLPSLPLGQAPVGQFDSSSGVHQVSNMYWIAWKMKQ